MVNMGGRAYSAALPPAAQLSPCVVMTRCWLGAGACASDEARCEGGRMALPRPPCRLLSDQTMRSRWLGITGKIFAVPGNLHPAIAVSKQCTKNDEH
jgi:hypothetical protein